MYCYTAIEKQKIRERIRERKKGRTGELEKEKKERKGEERRKRKKERELVARGQWSVSGITASGWQRDGVTGGGAVQR